MQWQCADRVLDLSRPVVMGVLNVTPDSFSDGNRYAAVDAALARAGELVREGAAIIDVGGESTRPGSMGVSGAVELDRVLPVIGGIAAAFPGTAISIDTSKPEVMAAAMRAGACIINDINALRAPGARAVASETRAGICLMHMKGEPRTMQNDPRYDDVVGEVCDFLAAARDAALEAGVAPRCIAFDPGIGFGKGLEHNLTLLRGLERLAALGAPLLVGLSRKSFIGRILGRPVDERLHGSLGLAALAVAKGARVVRTHDVAATRDAIGMVDAVLNGSPA